MRSDYHRPALELRQGDHAVGTFLHAFNAGNVAAAAAYLDHLMAGLAGHLDPDREWAVVEAVRLEPDVLE